MFSRRERDFLALLVRGPDGNPTVTNALFSSFPNPGYQRKILWGIRRKVAEVVPDLELYVRAAQVEPKVLPLETPRPSENLPHMEDPLVTVLRSVQAFLTRAPRRPDGKAGSPREPHSGGR